MKHFRLILTVMRIVAAVLFAANVVFMTQLYDSIRERYIDDVEQCLRRADLIELIDRITKAGEDSDGTVEMWVGLQKSDIGVARTAEELERADYSQGFRRVDRQLVSLTAAYLHSAYDGIIGEPDMGVLEDAFRREMRFSGFEPDEVIILAPGGCAEFSDDLWKIVHEVNGELIYDAYISPLAGDVLSEMSGVIVTTVLIALMLTFGFWYLLRVINRMRTIEEMKDDFTNNMTHELKTPIAIAYAANDALLQFPDPGDTERTRRYLTASLEQLTKLTGLVENILAMSMERRKNLTMQKERVELRPFLAALIEQHRLSAAKPCEITLECDDDAAVQADPTHLGNVMGNLIDNSIKYSGESVMITVKADCNSISVADNGVGIPTDSLEDIFKKFYRVHVDGRDDVRGYGIGLFYVKTIVVKHGWHIGVESRVGEGTTFTIKFNRES